MKLICGRSVRFILYLVLFPGLSGSGLRAEGTKQVIPMTGGQGALEINKYRNDFGFFDGNPVGGGKTLYATITCVNGITHLPLDDIEFNDNGFIVSQVRPPGGQYSVDGVITDMLDTDHDSTGPHLVIYAYTEPAGCTATGSAIITLKDCSEESVPVYFPDAFTPGNDGMNDRFRPVIKDPKIFTRFRLQVFNRTGQTVFLTTDPVAGWNGILNGSFCPPGVYAWKAVFELSIRPGTTLTRNGTVTLVR